MYRAVILALVWPAGFWASLPWRFAY